MVKKEHRKPMNAWSYLAVCFPFGLAPVAPGTWGSLPGVVFGLLLGNLYRQFYWSWLAILLFLALAALLAYKVIDETETLWQSHDDKSIVIDEFVGQAIPLAFVAPSFSSAILGFLLFRIFDILKPGPIGWADKKLHGAWGTLLDDVFAGIAALGVLKLALWLFPVLV